MSKLEKAYNIIKSIEKYYDNEKAFRKYFKSLSDYYTFEVCFEELHTKGFAYCMVEEVKNIYKKLGFEIIKEYVNYKIIL
jgi:mannose/fructose/N-acetylgalactosamine-specific phosphotransferase system component IID